MSQPKKTIVTCAVTGSSLTPSMSLYLPVTPDEIAEQSIDAVKAGAAVLHLHARKDNGEPTGDLEVWRRFVPRLQKETPAIINMSASRGGSAEERIEAALELRPDIATVIVGSMSYGLFKKAVDQGVTDFAQDWEREFFGEKAYQRVTQNSFHTIDRMIGAFLDHDIGMEFECYDVGHLYILDHHLSRHRNVKRPLIVQFLTGILGGIPSEIDHLLYMKRTAERLFGDAAELFTHGTGTGNIKAATYGAMMGTHVRVGQEDNLFEKPGVPFKSNAHQVTKLIDILASLNIECASPQEAREILGLPVSSISGADHVRR